MSNPDRLSRFRDVLPDGVDPYPPALPDVNVDALMPHLENFLSAVSSDPKLNGTIIQVTLSGDPHHRHSGKVLTINMGADSDRLDTIHRSMFGDHNNFLGDPSK